jgi:uncharacterized membrane protein YraQ (UPF0718 family)
MTLTGNRLWFRRALAVEPIQPQEAPDWVPQMWRSGRFNTWFWHSPGRMVAWLIAAPLVAAAATVLTPEETVEARAGRSGGGPSAPVPRL